MRYLVKLEDNPDVKITNNIFDYLSPLYIYIPILEKSQFKLNDYVYKNTYFGKEIASVSGTIEGSSKLFYQNKMVASLKIKNDFKENRATRKRKKKINKEEELINLLVKYNLEEISQKISKENPEELIITCIDEEIYSLNEFICLQNYYQEILETINELLRILNINKATIAIKNTNAKSIQNVKSIIGTYPNIKINLVPDKYLISYPQFLGEYLAKDINKVIFLKTNEVYKLSEVILKGKDICESLITISGDALLKSLVINTRLGVSLEELIEKFITITTNDYEIYLNGYLKGIKVDNLKDVVITKEIESIVINKKRDKLVEECINCGACQKICPYKINVKKCYFNNLNHKNCIGCGLCNYICPANIELKEIVKREL